MIYCLDGHGYSDDVISVLQIFYPNQHYELSSKASEAFAVSTLSENICSAAINTDEKVYYETKADSSDIEEIKRCIKLSLYMALKKINPIESPWGIITGVRPAKRIAVYRQLGIEDNEIFKLLQEKFLVRPEKIRLAVEVANAERDIINANNPNKISIYIGIPFCPEKCLYCSFASYPLSRCANMADDYISCLEKEISFMHDYMTGFDIEAVYIGGGTPTALNEKQLFRLLAIADKYIPHAREYTVEAGRPDTVSEEKLRLLKTFGVNRISINPQTINDETLKIIGRGHTVRQFFEAFELARKTGHSNINTDVILGLPNEDAADAEKTLAAITALEPESITVHTLAVKRAAALRGTWENYSMPSFHMMEKMLEIADSYVRKSGLHPYYMYRQKNMVGNFENVGYCRQGCESLYNVQIMEEKQTILAFGAGASTKIYEPEIDRVSRIYNVKSLEDYINRIDEMLMRKSIMTGGSGCEH